MAAAQTALASSVVSWTGAACSAELRTTHVAFLCGSPTPVPCRSVREAFGEAYEEAAAARQGKRQKRAGRPEGGPVAAVNDPTRARVEGILAASAQPVAAAAVAGGAGEEEVMQEQI